MRNPVLPIIILILSSCSLAFSQAPKEKLTREQKKELKKQEIINTVAHNIAKDSIEITIDKIRPSFAYNVDKSSYLGYTGHTLKLAHNKMSVNFIYIGEAPTAMMGDQNLYIYAKEQEVIPQKTVDQKNGNTHYYFTFANEYDETKAQTWECFAEIQPTGQTVITMQTKGMNPMIYQGYMEIEKTTNKKNRK